MEITNTNITDNQRILVLGSSPHTRSITSYNWDNLPNDLNVADYDVVILNLVPLLNKEFAQNLKLETLPSIEQFARLLFSYGSEIIVIGFPDIILGKNPYQNIKYWLPPAIPKFTYEQGEKICEIDPEFDYYFNYVKSWFFYINPDYQEEYPHYPKENYLRLLDPQAHGLLYSVIPIAQTRFQKPIAFHLNFAARNLSNENIVKESGNIIWLPLPTEISDYEAVNLILRKRYNLCLEQLPPVWVENYKLPAQLPIEKTISQHKQEIQRLETELAKAQEDWKIAVRFRRLLYEQGEDGLEPVVREALRELGANVEDPPPKINREDGKLTDPNGRKAILEIKGRTKSLQLGDVRQLDQWVRDALLSEENWEGKGILIANTYCNQPLEERDNAFPPNCIEKAKIAEQCLMTTTQLFRALCSHQRGELDQAAFWDIVFNTNGVCLLPEMEALDGN